MEGGIQHRPLPSVLNMVRGGIEVLRSTACDNHSTWGDNRWCSSIILCRCAPVLRHLWPRLLNLKGLHFFTRHCHCRQLAFQNFEFQKRIRRQHIATGWSWFGRRVPVGRRGRSDVQNQLPQWTRNPHCSCLQHRSWVTHPGYQTKEWELAATEPDIS